MQGIIQSPSAQTDMNLIQEKLDRVKKADYTKCAEVQAFIQEMVDREDLVNWATREDYTASITMALPEKKRHYKFMAYIP